MPELPEVEVTKLGLCEHLGGKKVINCWVYQHQLRWPIPENLALLINQKTIQSLSRRGKYLLIQFKEIEANILIHLGMSGHLRLLAQWQPPAKHTHVDLQLDNKTILRYTDPRRFGCWLIAEPPIEQHPLLKHLGPEPLNNDLTGAYLYKVTRKRVIAIKNLIMQQSIIVGIGNIYANEALFHAGIRPDRSSKSLSQQECQILASSIATTLQTAIDAGGTSLQDFFSADGRPGYFSLSLTVYNKQGQPCTICQTQLEQLTINQRQSTFCPYCQK